MTDLSSLPSMTRPGFHPECRHYSGYKPCPKGGDHCDQCGPEDLRGTEILIIKLGAMGDALRSKCLLTGLKRRWPQSWITWLTHPGSEAIVGDPLVDEVRVLNTEGVLALEGRRFDVLLCLDKDAAALALARKLNAELKLGYAPTAHNTVDVWNKGAEYALRLGLSNEAKYRENRLSHQRILYRMAEMEYDNDEYGLSVGDSSRIAADSLFAKLKVPANRPVIGINTGCGPVFETKAWTVEGFVQLINSLGAAGDVSLVLLGGRLEEPLHCELMTACGNLTGKTLFDSGNFNSLEDFFAIVGKCDVVLSSDSLAMHVAIALKKHVVAFFGPTCEQEIDLFGRGEKIVTDYGCSPCYLKRCDVRPSCMQAMTAESVEAAVRRVLASRQPVERTGT